MNKQTNFNKEEFASLLDKAKGNRSINQYAKETDVSAAHISRFLRQLIDAAPNPETISKFADKAYNDVSYRDMMSAAGHITVSENQIEEDSFAQRLEKMQKLEQKVFQTVMSFLMNQEFEWNMEKPKGTIEYPDLTINLEENEEYDNWFFEYIINNNQNSGMPPSSIYQYYGRILTFKLSPRDKFTIVTNSEILYKQIAKKPPVNLRANLFVMLVNLESNEVVIETQICEYE